MRVLIFSLLGLLLSCGSGQTEKKTIKVACAANMVMALDSLAVVFEAEHAIHCDITPGSSGMLTSQIENGAPYDVFFCANMHYPEILHKEKNGEKPIVYAKGRLVFVVDKSKQYGSIEEALNDKNLKRIGVADHQVAPYGMATDQYLKNIEKKEVLKAQLVTGESIGQVNQYISTGAVDAGFTSYSFKIINEANYNYFEVDPSLFEPINQGVMILKHGLTYNEIESRALISFLSSSKAKAILNYFGYLTE